MRSLVLTAALAAATAHGQATTSQQREDLVLGCAIASALVAVRFQAGSPSRSALEERATAYTQLARQAFGVTEEAIAVGLRALTSKVNTGMTPWHEVVAFAQQCPAVPTI